MTVLQDFDRQGCGCDRPEAVSGLLSIAEAMAAIGAVVSKAPLRTPVNLPLAEAIGRVLAEDCIATSCTPPFDNSAMDGFAVSLAGQPSDGPHVFRLIGRTLAGQAAGVTLNAGECQQVFTGAPLPPGANAVIMQEDVEALGSQVVTSHRPRMGQHIRRAGEDMSPGQVLMTAGTRLGVKEIATLAAAGLGEVAVAPRPRVALLVTGDEVRKCGASLSDGQIWDVNGPMLSAAVVQAGGELVCCTHAPDTAEGVQQMMHALSQQAEIVVTVGGLSVGMADYVKPAVQSLGGQVVFSGVAMKPGKPVSFGQLPDTLWLGLPGNPVSALVTWTLFGRCLLARLSGQSGGDHRRHVVAHRDVRHPAGRCELRLARLAGFDGHGREVVDCPKDTQSAQVSRLPAADGLIFIPAEADRIAAGDLIEFLPFGC